MVSGQITDAQIVASSHADRGWVPENSRLLTGRSGWTQLQTKQPFRNEWLQVGLTVAPVGLEGARVGLQVALVGLRVAQDRL